MNTRIFIVEDERIVAEDIRMSLESRGYIVAGIASNRDQAIEAIRRTSPQLVLMDIVLKGPDDGIETARLVRELFGIPVIYLTSHADEATLHRAKITEPFGYIIKPFEERDLFSAVEIALYRRQVEERLQEKERWLATILGSIAEGVLAVDAIGVIRLANTAAERIGGWQADELVGRELADVYQVTDPVTQQQVELPSLLALLAGTGHSSDSDLRLLTRKDGRKALIQESVAPISDAAGTVSGVVLVLRDAWGVAPGTA
ncbi:MAG TPA: response regulator [Bryobacteraceae bacterium]|jgi:PAS domain S-box-containing protein|nr:response regulator [Bryobacteraceae bacterium]